MNARNQEVVAKVPLGVNPISVAAAPGAVWIADRDGEAVFRVDPSTNEIVARIELGARPTSIAVGEGAVWVAVT